MPKNIGLLFNKAVNSVAGKRGFIDRLAGTTARDSETVARVLNSRNSGLYSKTPSSLKTRANRVAEVDRGRSTQTRVTTGLVGTGAVGGGFIGLHKYHQHKDNRILQQIDKLYKKPV